MVDRPNDVERFMDAHVFWPAPTLVGGRRDPWRVGLYRWLHHRHTAASAARRGAVRAVPGVGQFC